jgi:hypothetical protein
LIVIAEMAQTGEVSGAALELSTRVWLLCHGGILEVGGARITLVPLAFTALIAFAFHGVASYAGKQLSLSSASDLKMGFAVAKVTGVGVISYFAVVTAAAIIVDTGGPHTRASLGAIALSALMGFMGSRKALKWNFHHSWPLWSRAIPSAMWAGVLIAVLGGTAAFVTGLILNHTQFIAMTDQLNPGWAGGVILAFLQLFYVLNIVVWCTSWTFGPGFTLGDGSVVSLAGSHVGLLPAFPVTAALPAGVSSVWDLMWLAFPAAAGVGAAVRILRARPRARFDETALVGGLAGALSGVAVTGVAALTSGSLGVDRLVDLGPFVVPLLIIAPCIMGLAGILTGLVAGLIRRPKEPTDLPWWSHWKSEDDTQERRIVTPAEQSDIDMAGADEVTVPAGTEPVTPVEAEVGAATAVTKATEGTAAGEIEVNPAAHSDPSTVATTEATEPAAGTEDTEAPPARGWLSKVYRRFRPGERAGQAEAARSAVVTPEHTTTLKGLAEKQAGEEQPAFDFYADQRGFE